MIEKLKFISITGPRDDFDRVVNHYLMKYDIHLENALTELSTSYNLRPFVEPNPYQELVSKSEALVKKLELPTQTSPEELIPAEEAVLTINSAADMLYDLNTKKHELKKQRQECNELLTQIEHFRHLDYNIHQIINLKFIKYRFGRVPHEYYTRFSKSVYDNLTTVFYECEQDRDYVWGLYFVPANEAVRTDAIYASLHFERIKLPDAYEGTPEESYLSIQNKLSEINHELDQVYALIKESLTSQSDRLELSYHTISVLSQNFDVRRMAACTRDTGKDDVFYILCGWISEQDAIKLLEDAGNDSLVYCVCDDGRAQEVKPPTKLKNIKLFRPFEMFIKMYGLPAYNEIDPTSFVAITYSLIFGIMFGDVGQGFCLVIGGAILYRIKHMNLAAIISLAGVFSVIFGFLYGSVFGFEDWISPVWLSPRENVMTILLTSVGFGIILILVAMVLNIINSIKAGDWGRAFFDTNGFAGLLFYGALIGSVALIMTGHPLPGTFVMGIFIGFPLLLLFFKEPLTHIIEKKTDILPEHKALFFMETFFELFEILLSYITNTISFLRIGAFALSHAGMMAVVMLLAGAETGNVNLLVLIIGNLLVAGMEGLIVGIQVLRLEYYEMFGRFYKGNGKEFKSYKNKPN